MSNATFIRIPQPCQESWDAMTLVAQGRHCAACQKTVVDFTLKTDAEILAALRQAAGQACGRLRADQLARPLVPAAQPSRWRSWLGAVLALGGVLGSSRVAAQTRGSYYAGPLPAASSPASGVPKLPATPVVAPLPLSARSASELVTVRGIVFDARTHEPLPGVTILLKATATGTSTNAAGEFELPFMPTAQSATILVSMVGYVHQEKTLPLTPNSPLQVELLLDTQVLGGLFIIDYKRPWPWHPRRFFNWSKYWVTKPFRG